MLNTLLIWLSDVVRMEFGLRESGAALRALGLEGCVDGALSADKTDPKPAEGEMDGAFGVGEKSGIQDLGSKGKIDDGTAELSAEDDKNWDKAATKLAKR